MKILIIFIAWLIFGLMGAFSTGSHEFGLFIICAIIFPILSIILFFNLLGLLISPKKRYRELNSEEKVEYIHDKTTEHITLDHPEYIGLLTKIDKKKIAEEYLETMKKEKNYGKNK